MGGTRGNDERGSQRPTDVTGWRRIRWRRRCAYCGTRGCGRTCPQYQAVRDAEISYDEARAAARRTAGADRRGGHPGPTDVAAFDPSPDLGRLRGG